MLRLLLGVAVGVLLWSNPDARRSRAFVRIPAQVITHTDIKPENLLIGEGDRIQICDLGMGQRGAKPNSRSRWSVVGEIGTLWYVDE